MIFFILPGLVLNYLTIGVVVFSIDIINDLNCVKVGRTDTTKERILVTLFGWPALVTDVVSEGVSRAKQIKKI